MSEKWDGEWWADSFESGETVGVEYESAVYRLMKASTDAEKRNIAREIFQLGHDHGYELCRDLSYED